MGSCHYLLQTVGRQLSNETFYQLTLEVLQATTFLEYVCDVLLRKVERGYDDDDSDNDDEHQGGIPGVTSDNSLSLFWNVGFRVLRSYGRHESVIHQLFACRCSQGVVRSRSWGRHPTTGAIL